MGNIINDNKETVINCHIHETPYNGICADPNCFSGGFICLKCNPEACTVKDSHELITLDEFYLRFLARSSNTIDFKRLNEVIESLKQIDREYLTEQITNYKKYAINLIDNKLKSLSHTVSTKLDSIKERINTRLEKLLIEHSDAESRIDLSFEVPENFSLEETKKFFESNCQNVNELEKMINLIKKYSDKEKLDSNQKDLETIFYSRNIVDNNPKTLLEEKLNKIILDLKQGLEDLTRMLVFAPESTNIFLFGLRRFLSDPNQLQQKMILTNTAQKSYTIDSVFVTFTAIDGTSYVAWGNTKNALDLYDLKLGQVVKSLVGHTKHIFIVRHFLHLKESVDYLITTSYDKNVNIWNVNTSSLFKTIVNSHTSLYLYSAMLLFDDSIGKFYALTSAPNESVKVWDAASAAFVRNVGTTTDYTYFINSWYDSKAGETYIINANSLDVKMYNFKSGTLYKTFKPDSSTWHMSALVLELDNKPYLFETDGNGYLRVWDVHTGLIHKSIKCASCNLRGLCVWNEQYILAASSDKGFKIIDIKNFEMKNTLVGHDNVVCSLEKTIHPVHGEVLFTSSIDGTIRLWTIK